MQPVYIENNSNFSKIENKIFIKKSFISDEEYKNLILDTESLSEDKWNTHPTDLREDGMISINLQTTMPISQLLIDSIIPKYWINEHKTVNRIKINHEPSKFGWDEWSVADYVAVFYFGDFEGGNLKCFKSNSDTEYDLLNIETNTLYLLPIMDKQRYQSEKVTSGVKYSWVDWVYHHSEWAIP